MGLFQFVKIGSFQSGNKKQKAQEILAKEGIFYKIKVKSSLKMNSFDSAVLGNKYNPIEKMTYFLYVKKEDEERTRLLLKNI